MTTDHSLSPRPARHYSPWILSGLLLTVAYGLLGLTFAEQLSHAVIMQRCVLVDPKMARIWSVGNVEIGLAYLGVFVGMTGYFVQIFRQNRSHLSDLGVACLYLACSFAIDFICVKQFHPFTALLIGDAIIMTFTVIVSRQLWFQRLLGVFVPLIFLTCGIGHFLEGLSYWQLTYPFNVPWTMVTADIGFAVLVNSARFPAFIRGQDVVEELKEAQARAEELDRQLVVIRQAEEAQRTSEERFRATFEQAAVGIAHVGLGGEWLRVNDKLCEIVGYSRKELLSCTFQAITHPSDLEADLDYVRRMLEGEIRTYTMEKRYLRKDASIVWINLTVSLVRELSNEPSYFISVIEDITERKRLEEQVAQLQKMEGIGKLAGGIAHDFNNLLTGIMGYSELAISTIRPDDRVREYLLSIRSAGDRATTLTRQLLAFARRQVIEPKVTSLNKLVLNLEKMLLRLIGEDIEIVVMAASDLWFVHVDPCQIEQVLINLAVNSRDAMPEGGRLTIETANVTLDEAYARLHPSSVTPGDYVMLAVSDTGMGMPPEVQAHIFEPFFTTKEVGKGTGLGLATCYGIVKQSGGNISFHTEPGQGTTFKVYLPRVSAALKASPLRSEVDLPLRGAETVLVVEDEPIVREIAGQTLRMHGYRVMEAESPADALETAVEYTEEIHLLLTDMVMPQMSGKRLAEQIQSLRPDIKTLYMSGYTDNSVVCHGVLEPGIVFLQKPFTVQTLTRKVREALEAA